MASRFAFPRFGEVAFESEAAVVRQLLPFLAIALIFFLVPMTHDAAWQMWIGRQMLHGADLYTDIVEVNPPIWFWISVPIAGLAEVLKVPGLTALAAFLFLTVAISTWLSKQVLRSDAPLWPILVAMVFPLQHFAQREHFALIVAIPYVLLVALRERGDTVPTRQAAFIGLVAALGFALKPQFALVPLALEIWAWKARRIRPETVALAAFAAAYSVALLVFESDYLKNALPLILTAYSEFKPLELQSLLPSLAAFLFACPLLVRARGVAAAFTVAGLSFYLIYILQLKGWPYQAVPALGMLLVAVAFVTRASNVQKALAFASTIVILAPNAVPYSTPERFALDLPKSTSFAALSISPRAAWPMVEARELKWPLRYFSLWMAPSVRPDVMDDLACNPPDVLLIDDRFVNFSQQVVPILPYFRIVQDGPVSIYRRIGVPPKPANCRFVH